MTYHYKPLISKFTLTNEQDIILVNIQQQTLMLLSHDETIKQWPVSSAKAGIGNRQNSLQTPLGAHIIADKIGEGEPVGSVFVGRQPSGKIATIIDKPISSDVDLITSRILWLKGLEPGTNLGGKVDTFERFIYIHGTDEEGLIGTPASHGCIRMRNEDIITLFDMVTVGTPVYICESQNTLDLV